MLNRINVLNAGYVIIRDYMGDDLSVVRAARLSYDEDWRTGENEGRDEKLIRYLLTNRHTSPFEHVMFTFEVKAPLFVIRQWQRHRTQKFNEVSARYTELPSDFYIPDLEQITTQHSSNKQMRTNEQNVYCQQIQDIMREACDRSYREYMTLLGMDCPRELARSVLPVGIYSKMAVSVDLHNLMHFLKLRLHEHAQYEIRVYAQAILDLIEPIVPLTIKYFKETL